MEVGKARKLGIKRPISAILASKILYEDTKSFLS